ncbi:cytosol aminopeptidase family, catalytic domain-containing protein [Infundibulicybe gibba]|nr:cytosol aminopeptidase family, catalytic domain-containing protein [Infundibulicybe gibba]
MTSTAYIVPFDHQSSSDLVPGLNPARSGPLLPPATTPKGWNDPHLYNTPESKLTVLSSLGEKFPSNLEVFVDASADPHAAGKLVDLSRICVVCSFVSWCSPAVAAYLALYKFTLKTSPPSPFNPSQKEPIPERLTFLLFNPPRNGSEAPFMQSLRTLPERYLMELPANMMTPTVFTERVKAEFSGLANVEIFVHDEAWAAEKNMNTFLSVTHGTSVPAKFLEIHYKGASSPDAQPLAFVGKGITFDSGGISLKPAEVSGAAAVVSAALAIAQLRIPINLIVCTPLTENMPGPSATKPGDIIYAMSGKSVEVDNTDAEGRLILADAIYYTSTTYKPHTLIDVATLTGAMRIALGEIFSGVFSTSDSLWEQLRAAGETEYDRFWRMPLDEDFGPQIHSSNADLQNAGGTPGGSCTAALFLKPFADGIEPAEGEQEPAMKWAHIDLGGKMEAQKAMAGRPVRSLVEYACRLANN